MAKFEMKGKDLYVNGHKVLEMWESFSGWYWYGFHKYTDMPNVWFGLVQGFEEEEGDFSEDELNSLKGQIWKVPKENWAFSGRRS